MKRSAISSNEMFGQIFLLVFVIVVNGNKCVNRIVPLLYLKADHNFIGHIFKSIKTVKWTFVQYRLATSKKLLTRLALPSPTRPSLTSNGIKALLPVTLPQV